MAVRPIPKQSILDCLPTAAEIGELRIVNKDLNFIQAMIKRADDLTSQALSATDYTQLVKITDNFTKLADRASSKVQALKNFSNEKVANTSQSLSSIVIVRPSNIQGRAINIFVDGEYISSLLPGAYTQDLVCPGTHRLKIAYTNIKTRYTEKRSTGQRVTFHADKKQLFL